MIVFNEGDRVKLKPIDSFRKEREDFPFEKRNHFSFGTDAFHEKHQNMIFTVSGGGYNMIQIINFEFRTTKLLRAERLKKINTEINFEDELFKL